jgi:hypothetical protein
MEDFGDHGFLTFVGAGFRQLIELGGECLVESITGHGLSLAGR